MSLTPKLNLAIIRAAEAHDGQFRKGTKTPYIIHPFGVMQIIQNYTKDEEVLIAALLHDVLEDVSEDKYNAEIMKTEFGERVVKIVLGVSEIKTRQGEILPWKQRKINYLKTLSQAEIGSIYVSVGDKIHNMMSIIHDRNEIGEEVWNKFAVPKSETIWFYEEVYNLIKTKEIPQELKELYAETFEMMSLRSLPSPSE